MSAKHKAHVQQWKKDIVNKISKEVKNYETIATVNLRNLPSKQSQIIRSKIKNDAKLIVTKKRLMRRGLKKCDRNSMSDLVEHLEGMPALILTNKDPFDLFKMLKKNMSNVPAKAGQTAPKDIWVDEGPTPFSPGPIIGEMGGAGIPAGIEDGKVIIKKKSQVLKKGDSVPKKTANILSRLDIKPMKIGLNIVAAYQDGNLFKRETLNVDVEEYTKKLKQAINRGMKLAIGADILTKETAEIKVREAHLNAKKLAIGAEVVCEETKELLIKKADSQAKALKEKISVNKTKTDKNKKEKNNNHGG